MPFSGLSGFISCLDKNGELNRIKSFVNPVLEVAEITDRVTKNGGKALLFENNGTQFPLLINAYGSDKRMAMALGREDLGSISDDLNFIIERLILSDKSGLGILASLKNLSRLANFFPARIRRKGKCQKVIYNDPDLSVLPVLKCWPHDGGRYITLPLVHTKHPVTGKTNVGMYRMQILDNNTTGMHWQRHKTGAAHFEAWKETGKKMPVTVTLGGDPSYAYCASAPLPENVDEYILAGFLRRKKVKLVKCITNELYVPSDSDIVIEGYVDPMEDPVPEGPFGDHTGFYSLIDNYPRFHITCITHSTKAVYPATIVGIPPQEDAWLTKATEMIFLTPVRLTLQPEIIDFHMPDAGVAHNLVIVRIKKSYPGQGKKVISSLLGAGQMMFTKYIILTSGEIDIRNYGILTQHLLQNTDVRTDLLFSSGPLDVLDHSSGRPAMGGKLGIDGTVKTQEETQDRDVQADSGSIIDKPVLEMITQTVKSAGGDLNLATGSILIFSVNQESVPDSLYDVKKAIKEYKGSNIRLVLAVDNTVDVNDLSMVAWQVMGNSDCSRDIELISGRMLFIDGTIKAFMKGGFRRRWPEVVCSSSVTIGEIDRKWESLGLGHLIQSPSLRYSKLVRGDSAEFMPPSK